jgi:hypothetical protein
MGTENDPKIGAVKMLSIMLKEDQGWKYMAVDPVTNQNIESVDTDGCAWCHEDRKHSDFTFRALEAL